MYVCKFFMCEFFSCACVEGKEACIYAFVRACAEGEGDEHAESMNAGGGEGERNKKTCLAVFGFSHGSVPLGLIDCILFNGDGPVHRLRKRKCSILAKAAHESVALLSKGRILGIPEGVEGFAPFLILVLLLLGWTQVGSTPPPMLMMLLLLLLLARWSRGELYHVLGAEACSGAGHRNTIQDGQNAYSSPHEGHDDNVL
jgi:hypothetical protein